MTAPLALGIDLGGTQVRVGLVENGRVLCRAASPTDVRGGPVAILHQFKRLMSAVCDPEDYERICAIGISSPGPLDSETGVILSIPTLPGWESFPLKDALEEAFHLPVVVENDGIAAAYGEWQYGAGMGLRHMVYVTVSTGIGGGVVVDGRLMHGRRGMGAHVGHFRMAAEGPCCSCGATACFEALAAGSALGLRARKAAHDCAKSMLAKISRSEVIDARHVVAGARLGDPMCLELLREEAKYLGAGFTGLIHLFSPERVIMGGGVSNAFDLMESEIHSVIQRDAMTPFKTVPVVPAGLEDDSGLVGAAALALVETQRIVPKERGDLNHVPRQIEA
jgi:glucokinase